MLLLPMTFITGMITLQIHGRPIHPAFATVETEQSVLTKLSNKFEVIQVKSTN